jgi:hypothetical protein
MIISIIRAMGKQGKNAKYFSVGLAFFSNLWYNVLSIKTALLAAGQDAGS